MAISTPAPFPAPLPVAPMALTPGNSAKLFVDDNTTYAEALKLINSARTSIQFETFTFNGAQGQGIVNALTLAAARGVNVQVVLDSKAMWIGNQRKLAKELVAAGVDVRQYRERDLNRAALAIDHAKNLTIDGQTSLVGGTNFDRRVNYDFNYEIQGPAVPQIQDMFAKSWANSASQADLGSKPTGKPPVDTFVRGPGAPVPGGDAAVGITETGARGDSNGAQTDRNALASIAAAKTSIDLLMYNVDDPKEIQALVDAKKRGVQVRVVLNHETGTNLFSKAKNQALNLNMSAVEQLKAAGIEVHWFKLPPGLSEMHAKVAIFDGQEVLGGSTNWVTSSNFDNHELGIWLKGAAANQSQAVFNGIWQTQSTRIDTLSRADKVRADIASFMSRYL